MKVIENGVSLQLKLTLESLTLFRTSNLCRVERPAIIEVLKIRNPSQIAYCEISSRGSCWASLLLSTFVALLRLKRKSVFKFDVFEHLRKVSSLPF